MTIRTSQRGADEDLFLDFLDVSGVDKAVLSYHGSRGGDPTQWHDYAADLVSRYPDRFAAFANCDPLGGEDAFAELERAVEDLGFCGVHAFARNDGVFLDDEAMYPFYEAVSDLGVPISVHVERDPAGFEALRAPYALHYVMARELDMLVATLRLVLGGVLEDFPDLDFVMTHYGGGVSSLLDRIEYYMELADGPAWEGGFYRGEPQLSGSWRDSFDRLYFSMAGRVDGRAALECALTNISPDRLLFATDWPRNFDGEPERVREYIRSVESLDLPRDAIDGILGGNAAELFDLE